MPLPKPPKPPAPKRPAPGGAFRETAKKVSTARKSQPSTGMMKPTTRSKRAY
jgi:hypothetical protein